MDRFNAFRGPDQQITRLYKEDGAALPFSTPISGTLTAIVKRPSYSRLSIDSEALFASKQFEKLFRCNV